MPYYPNQQYQIPQVPLTQTYEHLHTIGGASFGEACKEADSTQEIEVE